MIPVLNCLFFRHRSRLYCDIATFIFIYVCLISISFIVRQKIYDGRLGNEITKTVAIYTIQATIYSLNENNLGTLQWIIFLFVGTNKY